ncbi:MAG: hypothetical protein JWM11_1196 [Planctomycetaceae bacterium]|nr:hypothetical protein [Planctomycetaceae bacterium]
MKARHPIASSGQSIPIQNGRRGGSTLLELLLAVSIAGVVAAGIQSSIFVAMKSLPSSTGIAQSSIQSGRTIDQIATELESAIYITEHTATTLGFTLPDRTGDGIPERVRYAWTGVAGGPLTRQYNGGTVVTLAPSANLFTLTPNYTTVSETYTGLAGEDAVESLLIDYSTGTSTSNKNVTSSTSMGQYFTMTLPANAYAWRPTRVQFMAKKSSSNAVTQVQMRPASGSMTPTSTILEQYTLADTSLTSSYAFQSFSFTTLSPIAPGGGICLVLARQSGTTSMVAQDNSGAGELSGLSSWSYSSSKALNCQLFGKLSRSGIPNSYNSNYLTSMGIALRISPTASVLQTTGAALNHPELLSGKWELKFDQTPTTVDMNGDATADWVVHGGGTFNANSLVNGIWTTSGTLLDTAPGNDFAKTTIVDLRLQNTTTGGNGATFAINALRSGTTCAPILAYLKLQADGTQTLTVSKKTNDSTTQTLVNVTGLPGSAVDLHLIIDPIAAAVCIKANGVERGTFAVTRFNSSDASRTVTIGASGSTARFSYASIRVLEQ